MGLGDKIKNAAQEAGGKIKEEWGDLTDNERLEAEGKLQQAEANAKQGVEHAKDGLQDAKDEAGDVIHDAKRDVKDAWDKATDGDGDIRR